MKRGISVHIRIEIISLWNGIATIAVFANDKLIGVMAGPSPYPHLEGGE